MAGPLHRSILLMDSLARGAGFRVKGRRRFALWATVFALAAAPCGGAGALALGPIAEQSGLGQPLRVAVPVVLLAGESLAGECVRLASSSAPQADGVPEITSARLAIETGSAGRRVVVSTQRAVNEPAIRLTLEVGCDRPVRHEYTILLDLVPREAPSWARSAIAPPMSARTAPTAVGAGRSSSVAPATAASGNATIARGTDRAAPAAPEGPGWRPNGLRPQASAREVASAGASNRTSAPRLTVSRGSAAAPSSDPDSRTPSEALDEQEQVLRNRIAELSVLIQQMQQERIEQLESEVALLELRIRAADAARDAAEKAARAGPSAAMTRWFDPYGPWIAAALGIALIVLAGVAWKHRRQAVAGVQPRGALATAFVPTVLGEVDSVADPAPPSRRTNTQGLDTPSRSRTPHAGPDLPARPLPRSAAAEIASVHDPEFDAELSHHRTRGGQGRSSRAGRR